MRPGPQLERFRQKLLAWYRANRRDLPWRAAVPKAGACRRDWYRVWLAEVMLQQTRITAVVPYYTKFLERFPGVSALAAAPEAEVLRYWAGLGYYSRARNLHRAAREITASWHGEFPRDYDSALRLPGIGRYTAAAVLSIAFGVPLAVVDGNVARVLARVAGLRGELRAPRTWSRLARDARTFLDRESAGDWNEGLMELGETVCTPQSPRCAECPVSRFCKARRAGLQEKIPAPRRNRRQVSVEIAAAVLTDSRGRALLVRDPGAHDAVLFSRMWQFPAVEVAIDAAKELKSHLAATLGITAGDLRELSPARHAVTFRNVKLLPYLGRMKQSPKGHRRRLVALDRLSQLPVSSATRKIAEAALRAL